MIETVLEVSNLGVEFQLHRRKFKVIEDISFSVNMGETLGVVGESGSGKSITMLAVMELLPWTARVTSGSVMFKGIDLLRDENIAKVRGKDMAMVFQDPMSSLNPSLKIKTQLTEVLIEHEKLSFYDAYGRSLQMLKLVGMADAKSVMERYPFELSGGMRQRVMIAMAMLCKPSLLIADEPTTSLDVTIQAQILELLRDLKEKFRTSVIFISHDMRIISEIADKVVVMYAGKIMEKSDRILFFKQPLHPYSKGLLMSVPDHKNSHSKRLYTIKGDPPNPTEFSKGCRFAPRCPYADKRCFEFSPPLYQVKNSFVSCWLYSREKENVK